MIWLLLACASPEPTTAVEAPETKPVVRSLSYPAGWLAETLAPGLDHATILPRGEDPPAWRPPPDQIAALGSADLLVAVGAGYEAWTATATLPASRFVDASTGLSLLEVAGRTHSHGAGGTHSHGEIDPHYWGDPMRFLAAARTVAAALEPHGDVALAPLESELRALDAELTAALAPLNGRALASNHPSYGYLADRYGLTIRAFDLDPASAPADPSAVLAWAAAADDPVLLWESPPSSAATDALAGMRHVYVDPLEQPAFAGPYDYAAQVRANLARWRAAAGE
jgi:zinc transport system substrate-binding protein